MRDEVLSHHEMVAREKISLQRGMNFQVRPGYSILLMSTRRNAPYEDRWDEERNLLVYQGHDVARGSEVDDPKSVDQPMRLPSGVLTQNGKFYEAAKGTAEHGASPERIRVYEKIKDGIWSDKGMFELRDASIAESGGRKVFEFYLAPVDDSSEEFAVAQHVELPRSRVIPSHVKVEVWKRDGGKCVECGSRDNLHFDHDVPFSRGGTSLTARNVRLLCARHNLAKSDKIQ